MNSQLQDIVEQLKTFDWRFIDYNPSLERVSINNIHWYPAPFVPHIPSILIKSLSKPGDIILDPFCGTGITGVEAARLNRRYIQFDINPQAIEIAQTKLVALRVVDERLVERIKKAVFLQNPEHQTFSIPNSIELEEAMKWFHPRTLTQLLNLRCLVLEETSEPIRQVLKFVFSSILYHASSQTKHYSYVTDKCYPEPNKLLERDANTLFLERLVLLLEAVNDFKVYCEVNKTISKLVSFGVSDLQDARDLSLLPTESIDMVVTSPPYLGVNDYVKSQRLTYLFFPPFPVIADSTEIGSRQKRHRKTAISDYRNDMIKCIDEILRVTKNDGFICLVLGQSSSIKGCDLVEELVKSTSLKLKSTPLVDIVRPIVFRKINNVGIGNERLVVFQKKMGV